MTTLPTSLSNLNITTFNKIYPLLVQKYSTLIPDPNANTLDKINSIIDSLNSVGNLSNDVVDNWNKVMAWVMNDGLTTDVSNKLDAMVTAGTFDTIFQKDIAPSLGDITQLQTTDKSNLTNALNEVDQLAKSNQTNVGTLSNLQTTHKTDLVSAVNDNVASLADIALNVKRPPSGLTPAKGDGTTDDTQAIQALVNYIGSKGGGKLYFPIGEYVISGVLQDPSGANAQLTLPQVNYVQQEQITISFIGEVPPPNIVSVIGTTPLPNNHVVIRSTLNSGSGGALLGGVGPSGTTAGFSNILVEIRNIGFRLPADPVLSGLNLYKVASVDLDNVVVDASSYSIPSISQPTTSNSYGIIMPARYNGAHSRMGSVDVIGFYNGYRFGEHSIGQQVAAWGCYKAFEFEAADHSSHFERLNVHHSTIGITFTGSHSVTIDNYNIEHANDGSWRVIVHDIDDGSNNGLGRIFWHVVKQNVGADTTFLVNGALNIEYYLMNGNPKIWNSPTLTNGWTNHGSWGYFAQYKIDRNGMVTIRGTVKGGTVGTSIFTLPSGYIPAVPLSFPSISGSSFGNINIHQDGTVTPDSSLGNSVVSLESIQFYIN